MPSNPSRKTELSLFFFFSCCMVTITSCRDIFSSIRVVLFFNISILSDIESTKIRWCDRFQWHQHRIRKRVPRTILPARIRTTMLSMIQTQPKISRLIPMKYHRHCRHPRQQQLRLRNIEGNTFILPKERHKSFVSRSKRLSSKMKPCLVHRTSTSDEELQIHLMSSHINEQPTHGILKVPSGTDGLIASIGRDEMLVV